MNITTVTKCMLGSAGGGEPRLRLGEPNQCQGFKRSKISPPRKKFVSAEAATEAVTAAVRALAGTEYRALIEPTARAALQVRHDSGYCCHNCLAVVLAEAVPEAFEVANRNSYYMYLGTCATLQFSPAPVWSQMQ